MIYPPPRRSSSGFHILLPASNSRGESVLVPLVPPQYDVLCWTLGRGAAIWLVWPSVLIFTIFSTIISAISAKYKVTFALSGELISVIGMVMGYVISYRLSSGYERYSTARDAWTTMMRTIRSMSRLVWIHIPLRLTFDSKRSRDTAIAEARQVMKEKRMALDLMEGFAVATKHHLRGEIGIFYEDLYDLVKPLHRHPRFKPNLRSTRVKFKATVKDDTEGENEGFQIHTVKPLHYMRDLPPLPSEDDLGSLKAPEDIEVINAKDNCSSEDEDEKPFLLPPAPRRVSKTKFRADLIPFSSLYPLFQRAFTRPRSSGGYILQYDMDGEDLEAEMKLRSAGHHIGKYRPISTSSVPNLPLEIIRTMDEWINRLDARGTVPANPLANLHISITSFETCFSTMEQILTTPLPFVYSAHIKQCVWMYLFVLPFQLVGSYGWYSVPAVALAAYFYLGLLAAGDEIEQPFGYDDNDLNLDSFCNEWIRNDLAAVREMRCPNAYFPQDKPGEGGWSPGVSPPTLRQSAQTQGLNH